jgi:L-2,4-diaminobutyrate decarboxylase
MIRSDLSFTLPQAAVDSLLRVNQAHAGSAGSVETLPSLLPQTGVGEAAALELLAPLVLGGAADLGGETVFAHMNPPTPWVTWVTTFWNAAVNQNLLHPETAPIALEIERQVMQWLAPAFGADGGLMVPGSTVANLTALWAARDLRKVSEVVASVDAHISIRKAAHLLGLRYREVAVDAERRLRPEMLGDLSSSALVLTAGTTSAGAIDPLTAGAGAAWRHVDAAWAGPLCLSERHKHLLEGMELADSVTVSAHKWFFQPKESALVFFSDYERAKGTLSFAGPYLAQPNVGLLGSHGATAVPLLATLLAWGREGLEERLNRCMEAAEQLATLVEASEEFVLFGRLSTGIVLWRPVRVSVEEALPLIRAATISTTVVEGVRWFRSVAANPMVDAAKVFAAVREAVLSVSREAVGAGLG